MAKQNDLADEDFDFMDYAAREALNDLVLYIGKHDIDEAHAHQALRILEMYVRTMSR